MLLTEARCMRMTSRNGSRLMYQPGQAPPVMSWGETGGVAQAQRAIVMRVARDPIRWVARVVHQNFLRGDHHVDGMAVGGNVKLAVGLQELHQVERSQVARRIVEEHVF